MAKTLRGAPIVGYYRSDKEDFSDHGEEITIDGDGVHFKNNTKPYGFVAPDAKVWFKDFEEEDEFGNSIIRTYLMTQGFLWTGQFQEAKKIFQDNGKPQSMELEEKSLQGQWATNIKQDMEFFIINDAIFSKLCILGDDVEPCFEGSAVTAPQVSASFTLDHDFKQTLFEMMQQLTNALKGGNTVAQIKDEILNEEEQVVETNFSLEEENSENQEQVAESPESTFEKKEQEQKDTSDKEDDTEDTTSEAEDEDDDDKEKEDQKKYSLLKESFDNLETQYAALQQELETLRSFKVDIENKQKDALISEFYMLSEEDKKDVIENKANFNLEDSSENEDSKKEEKSVITCNVDNTEDSTPDWIKAVESTMNSRF